MRRVATETGSNRMASRSENSTVTNNAAPDGFGSVVASSGNTATHTKILSTIVAANQGTDAELVSGDEFNSFDSKSYNLLGDGMDGQNGDDRPSGAGASDVLCGANGNDRLTGGAGPGTFDGGLGTDAATDYSTIEGDARTNIP